MLTPLQASNILSLIRAAKAVCPRPPPKITPTMKPGEANDRVRTWYASFVVAPIVLERLADEVHGIDGDTIDRLSRMLAE